MVLAHGASPSAAEIVNACESSSPPTRSPGMCSSIDGLPRNATGKVDKTELRETVCASSVSATPVARPGRAQTDAHPEWGALLDDVERRRAQAMAGGGEDKSRASTLKPPHRTRTHRPARRRRQLPRDRHVRDDPDQGRPAARLTFVCGVAEIDGRPVAIGAEDYTVERGGVGVHLNRLKGAWGGFIEELALGYRIPLIMLMQAPLAASTYKSSRATRSWFRRCRPSRYSSSSKRCRW